MVDAPDPRRAALLDAAVRVFVRYGYKKTSMDEVARAADLSRPGLYLHISTKEALFRDAVAHLLDRTRERAQAALAGEGPLAERVVAALSALYAPYVGGDAGQHVTELIEAARQLAPETITRHDDASRSLFVEALGPPHAEAWTDLLHALAVGFKHRCATVEDFDARLGRAVRLALAERGTGEAA